MLQFVKKMRLQTLKKACQMKTFTVSGREKSASDANVRGGIANVKGKIANVRGGIANVKSEIANVRSGIRNMRW